MIDLSNKQISLSRGEAAEVHRVKCLRLGRGESVRADDVLKTGLFLVAEVVRRMETPSFRIERLREYLEQTHALATKYNMLRQSWPGGEEINPRWIEAQQRALDILKLLMSNAPEREESRPFIDTSGDL